MMIREMRMRRFPCCVKEQASILLKNSVTMLFLVNVASKVAAGGCQAA